MEEIDVPNPTCRAQNCSLESLFLDDAEQHQPPACPTTCGRGQRFAVCCGPLLPRCGQGCCRQSLPPPTTAGPAAPRAAAAPHGFGPAFVDSGVSVVRQLTSLLIVKPETVLRWHRERWRGYWRRRSSRRGKTGRPPIAPEPRTLIRRMTMENRVWGQRRIQAELARLGFKVSARTIHRRGPSFRWRSFLRQRASAIWVCDFICV